MANIDFTGVFPAMSTPFTSDGRIDHETLADDRRLRAHFELSPLFRQPFAETNPIPDAEPEATEAE